MPRSKENQEQMRNKVIEISQSGKGYKVTSKAVGLQQTSGSAIIHKWQKHGTAENQEWLADQNSPKSAVMTYPIGHERPQNNIQRTAGLTCLS